jgi:hypothetical protein
VAHWAPVAVGWVERSETHRRGLLGHALLVHHVNRLEEEKDEHRAKPALPEH